MNVCPCFAAPPPSCSIPPPAPFSDTALASQQEAASWRVENDPCSLVPADCPAVLSIGREEQTWWRTDTPEHLAEMPHKWHALGERSCSRSAETPWPCPAPSGTQQARISLVEASRCCGYASAGARWSWALRAGAEHSCRQGEQSEQPSSGRAQTFSSPSVFNNSGF